MGDLLYYLPNVQGLSPEAISAAGLGYALGETRKGRGVLGPDGGRGVLAAATRPGDQDPFKYVADEQAWDKCDGGRFWIGYWRGRPPGPEQLLRDKRVAGHEIELADGNNWLVPLVRSISYGTLLPQALVLNAEGELVQEPLPGYQSICSSAERAWRQFRHQADQAEEESNATPGTFEATPGPLTKQEDWFNIATGALALNYRVTRWEISVLKLLNTDNVHDVVGAMIDLPLIFELGKVMAEASKKNAPADTPAGSGTSSGVAGSGPPATNPIGSISGSSQVNNDKRGD